jgi:surface antigen
LQCVPFARQVSGIEIYGDAHTWWRQAEGRYRRSHAPEPGAVIVLRGYRTAHRGHVAVVTHVLSKREILVDHANWLNRGEVSVRTPVVDVSPAGDWSEVRVWYIPTGQWGARIYSVQGFIHQG